MWTPRRRRQQLDLLCHHKRPELRGKAFHEILAGEDFCPVLPPVGIVSKFPEMDELVYRAGIGLEITDELLVMAALLERREPELLVELRRFRHLADMERVGSQFVQRHQGFSCSHLNFSGLSPLRGPRDRSNPLSVPVNYRRNTGPRRANALECESKSEKGC